MSAVAASCCKSGKGLKPVGAIGVNADGLWPLLFWRRTQHMDLLERIILQRAFESLLANRDLQRYS